MGHDVDMVLVTLPDVGCSTPEISRIKVDFPAPLAPQIPIASPL
jgi:hypothetical protein